MSSSQGSLSERADESARFWAEDARSELEQAEISGVASLCLAALAGYAASRGRSGLIEAVPLFALSGGALWLAFSEVREAMQLSRIAGSRAAEPVEYSPKV